MPEHTPSSGAGYGPPGQIQPEADEFTLIKRAKAGEREAFGLLAQRYGKTVLNLINKMIWDRTVAEDLWQETFVRALENITTYSTTGSAGTAGNEGHPRVRNEAWLNGHPAFVSTNVHVFPVLCVGVVREPPLRAFGQSQHLSAHQLAPRF